jgi:hypothetical protein
MLAVTFCLCPYVYAETAQNLTAHAGEEFSLYDYFAQEYRIFINSNL